MPTDNVHTMNTIICTETQECYRSMHRSDALILVCNKLSMIN